MVVTGAIKGSESLGQGVGTVSGAVVGGAVSGDLDPNNITKDAGKDGAERLIPVLERGAKRAPHLLWR